ncbi:methionyl-tRNA formyltransferase [Agaribacterium haliotis]|uniref:methionyl-tRNA formyltransferase n=1 Tax=Agaribacterium haliotis TaxID=2013869 RepID=UPI000BB54C1A|nr:methionyl-tRNA formyltransferase [Agaribacterium haliotis]
MPLKIIFAGTPVFAERHLQALIDSEHKVVAVYTQPDRPAGRGKKLSASPVKQLALTHDIPVLQPQSLKSDEAQAELADLGADLMVVVAYGLLLPKAVLDTPRLGCINVHGSILPRWRGAAPIQRAVEAGDKQTGITIMQMDIGLDTGAMLFKALCDIDSDETSASLHDKLAEIGPPALIKSLSLLEQGLIEAEAQDDKLSNYAAKIDKQEALIDWSETAELIERKLRAFFPFPVCYSELNGQRFKIHKATLIDNNSVGEVGVLSVVGDSVEVQCGRGKLSLEQIQLPGKKAMAVQDWLNGLNHRLPATKFEQA